MVYISRGGSGGGNGGTGLFYHYYYYSFYFLFGFGGGRSRMALIFILMMIGAAMIMTIISMTVSIHQLLRFNNINTIVNRDLSFSLGNIPPPHQKQPQQQQQKRGYLTTTMTMTTKHNNRGDDDEDDNDDVQDQSLPSWMEEYFTWHTQQLNQLKQLNYTNWHTNHKYLILRCLSTDVKCGGLSDRLQAIPLMIYKAYQTKRLLFIKWETNKPYPLETFLVPPTTTTSSTQIDSSPQLPILDWRIPSFLDEKIQYQLQPTILTLLEMVNVKPTDSRIVLDTYLFRQQGKFLKWYNYLLQKHQQQQLKEQKQSSLSSSLALLPNNKQNNNNNHNHNHQNELLLPTIESYYHVMWDRLFQPTQPIQTLIEKSMKELNITKNNYVAVHVRALYSNDTAAATAILQEEYQNAINCGLQLSSQEKKSTITNGYNNNNNDYPIFIASDSNDVIHGAVEYGRQYHINVISNNNQHQNTTNNQPPLRLHLDRGRSFLEAPGKDTTMTPRQYQPSDYYSTFVDLYLLKNARCIAYGRGGYGKWAQLLQQRQQQLQHSTPSCSIDYLKTTCRPPPPQRVLQ